MAVINKIPNVEQFLKCTAQSTGQVRMKMIINYSNFTVDSCSLKMKVVLFTANWFELDPEIEKNSGLAGIRNELENIEQSHRNSVRVGEFELSPDYDFAIHGLAAVPTLQFYVDGAPVPLVSKESRSAPWIKNKSRRNFGGDAYDLVGSSSEVRDQLCKFFADRWPQPEPKKLKSSPSLRESSRQIPANISKVSWKEISGKFRCKLEQANGKADGIQVGNLSADNVITYHHQAGLNSFLSEVDLPCTRVHCSD
jgi:hypothetical protein